MGNKIGTTAAANNEHHAVPPLPQQAAASSSPQPSLDARRLELETRLAALVKQVKARRVPVNLVISGPPGCDTEAFCRFLKSECGMSYEDEDTTTSSAAAVYSRHDAERQRGERSQSRHLREVLECMQRFENTAHDSLDERMRTTAHHLLQLQRYSFRHLKNTPTTDSMLNADRVTWQRSLWRVFRGAPNDEMYGYVCTSHAMGLVDDAMHALLHCQAKLAMDQMAKDCSPSNTLWVYITPHEEAYERLVTLALSHSPYQQHEDTDSRRRFYQKSYQHLDRMYRQSVFTTQYWSLHLETRHEALDRLSMLSAAISVFDYLVDTLMYHAFWGALDDKRQQYLNSERATRERVMYVPSFGTPLMTPAELLFSASISSAAPVAVSCSSSSSSGSSSSGVKTVVSSTLTGAGAAAAAAAASSTPPSLSTPVPTPSGSRIARVRSEANINTPLAHSSSAPSGLHVSYGATPQQLREAIDAHKRGTRKSAATGQRSRSHSMQTVNLDD
jgi:hypothetical protein